VTIVEEGGNLFAYQISMRYHNPRLRKLLLVWENGRRPYWNSTSSFILTCVSSRQGRWMHSASIYQIL